MGRVAPVSVGFDNKAALGALSHLNGVIQYDGVYGAASLPRWSAVADIVQPTAGVQNLTRIWLPQETGPSWWSGLDVYVSTAGITSSGANENQVGILSPSGAVLAGAGDAATAFASIGLVQTNFAASLDFSAYAFVWAVVVANFSTQPIFAGLAGLAGVQNAGLTSPDQAMAGTNGTGKHVVTAIATPHSSITATATPFWAGLRR